MIGEVHADGELIGSLGWSIRTALGKDAGDRIVWSALESLTPGANFDDFAKGIVTATQALVDDGTLQSGDVATVQGILAERGLDSCGRIIPLASGQQGNGTIFGLDILGQAFGASCSQLQGFGLVIPSLFHYSHTPAGDAVGVKLVVSGTSIGPGSLVVNVYARKNQPVMFSQNGPVPVASDFDHKIELTDGSGELVIDASSDPPFDPTATYNFVLDSGSCPTYQFTATAETILPASGEGGAGGAGGASAGGGSATGGGGAGGGAESDDGCGCTIIGSEARSGVGGFLGLLGLGLVAERAVRRKRA